MEEAVSTSNLTTSIQFGLQTSICTNFLPGREWYNKLIVVIIECIILHKCIHMSFHCYVVYTCLIVEKNRKWCE